MESFAEAIKIIAEKHLIPTILSLVIAAIVFAYTPTDYWLLEKFTTVGYWLFLAGAIFILIQFLIWIKKFISVINYNRINAEYEKQQIQERLEKLWCFLDCLSEEEINLLKQFLGNDNNPIIIRVPYLRGRLFEPEFTIKQTGHDEQGLFTKCVLTKHFYRDLRLSVKKFGKINHFDKV